jgi:hypothetical protein
VVACAWDGQTYIIDHHRTVVRFQFEENVNAFCAGEGGGAALSLCLLDFSVFHREQCENNNFRGTFLG